MKMPIYMDYHATTPVDPGVVEAMLPYMTDQFGNAASRQHAYGWEAEGAVEHARKSIAESINASPNEIVFTSGATESNNLALKGVAEAIRSKGNHIICGRTEHRSILDVCEVLSRNGFRVSYVDVDGEGVVRPEAVLGLMTSDTILVSVMAANNEIGTISPLEEIGRVCLERGVLFHSDATQAYGKIPLDVRRMNIHLLSISAHKICGPKGVGALYVRKKNPRVSLVPQQDGGGHEGGMRSGTLNVPGIVGLAKAAEISFRTLHEESGRVGMLRDRLEESLLSIDGARRNGDPANRLWNNISVTIPYVRAEGLIAALKNDIAISSGSACSSADRDAAKVSHVLHAVGLDDEMARCTIRIGVGRFTTAEEVEYAAGKIIDAVGVLRAQSPEYQLSMKSVSHNVPT